MKITFDWQLSRGIASASNFAILLVVLLSFPVVLHWTKRARLGSRSQAGVPLSGLCSLWFLNPYLRIFSNCAKSPNRASVVSRELAKVWRPLPRL
jgi:hypothetical protein